MVSVRSPATSPQPASDAEARQYLADLAAQATRHATHGAHAAMVWRQWGRGPVVVMLHGGSGSWSHWIHTIPALAPRYRLLVADLPGLGDSPLPPQPYCAESLARIVAGSIEQLLPGDQPVHLLGFSFGGILAGHVARLRAARVRSLTIVGSPPFGIGPTGLANAVMPVDSRLGFEAAQPLHRRNLERLMFADARAIDPLALRVHHDNLRRARLRSRKIARTDTLARALRSVFPGEHRCALNGIWGGEDVTVHPDLAAIRSLFTGLGGQLEVLPGAGHWAPYEAPSRFNAVLEARLQAA